MTQLIADCVYELVKRAKVTYLNGNLIDKTKIKKGVARQRNDVEEFFSQFDGKFNNG